MSTKFELEKITDINHYLKIESHKEKYIAGFIEIMQKISPHLTKKQMEILTTEKMLIGANKHFDKDKYISFACELTAMSIFLDSHGSTFVYERKISDKKDVDFSIKHLGFTYNIEVKCKKYTHIEPDADTIEIIPTNRIPNWQSTLQEIESTVEKKWGKNLFYAKIKT